MLPAMFVVFLLLFMIVLHFLLHPFVCMHAQLVQSCLTLCYPMDFSLPDSSVHGILQARILQWITIPSSRGSS